jgi:dolichyl-diphosphooligosaccharide--protein glycosyltransferase
MRRGGFVLGLAAAVLIGGFLRLGTRAELADGARVRAMTPDDNYHLRRARFAVAHYPRTILFDPLINVPGGGVPVWPPLFDVLLATPARVLDGPAATQDRIERGAAWVPFVLGTGAILFAGLLGRQVLGDVGGVVVSLFVAVCPGHIIWTQYGHDDQHAGETFFGMLALWLFLRSRDKETPAAEIAAGVALALATLAWQGAIYWGAIFALSLTLEAARTGRSVFRPALFVLGIAAVLAGLGTLWWLDGFRPPLTYAFFGLFQPLFLAALAGGVIGLDTLIGMRAGGRDRRALALRLGAVVLAAAATLPFAGPLALGLTRGLGYVAGQTSGEIPTASGYMSFPKNFLKGIFETRPLLADGPGLAADLLSFAFFLSPVVILIWILRAWRRERTGVHVALAVWGFVTLFLVLEQQMNTYYAAPLAGLALVEVARRALGRRRAPSPARRVAAAAVALILAAPFARSTPKELHAVHLPDPDLFATLEWMGRNIPRAVEPYDPRLLSAGRFPAGLDGVQSVLAPWSLGNQILYEAGLPVAANNFGYGFMDSIRFFLAESEDEALEIARARRARWVVAMDLLPRINDYESYLDRPPALKETPNGPAPTERYLRTLQSRLYDFDGEGLKMSAVTVPPLTRFRLRFRSATAIQRWGKVLPWMKVYEIVD